MQELRRRRKRIPECIASIAFDGRSGLNANQEDKTRA